MPNGAEPVKFLVILRNRQQIPSGLNGLYTRISSPICGNVTFNPWISYVHEGKTAIIADKGNIVAGWDMRHLFFVIFRSNKKLPSILNLLLIGLQVVQVNNTQLRCMYYQPGNIRSHPFTIWEKTPDKIALLSLQ